MISGKIQGKRLLWILIGKSFGIAAIQSFLRLLNGGDFEFPAFFLLWLFCILVFIVSTWVRPFYKNSIWFFPKPIRFVFPLTILTGFLIPYFETVVVSFIFTIGIISLLLACSRALYSTTHWIPGVLTFFAGGGFAALIPVILGQLTSRFSTEELYVLVEIMSMFVLWVFLWFGDVFQEYFGSRFEVVSSLGEDREGFPFQWPPILGVCFLMVIFGVWLAARAYQNSFYPLTAPQYAGISANTPYICGKVPLEPSVYKGEEVFETLLALVAANPNKGAPEYGLLAIGTREYRWADAFRDELLIEAQSDLFANPAVGIKFDQYLAGIRVYYYVKVEESFPELFSSTEKNLIKLWFAKINQTAMTPSGADWIYAIAFQKWPQGPYENQENGAGLLALLEISGLADPVLSYRNVDYLIKNPRGWDARFRVTDDAAIYQPEWIENAWHQYQFTGNADIQYINLSFNWLKLLALPDGSPMGYNHPVLLNNANFAGLGAELTKDPDYIWLLGRTVEYYEKSNSFLSARPGMEIKPKGPGSSPDNGSCLLYGGTGLPNQLGPLAPDKIIMRNGWDDEDLYLLLNLRFSGWHRYKATNTITMLYQNGILVEDKLTGKLLDWFPEERSLFRDKRIPRENLNGLIIEKTGLQALLYDLTGVDGKWAQDPPYYARVEQFETNDLFDVSTTLIEDWHGWTHRRTIYLVHDGPLVVTDEAFGPGAIDAEITWQLPEDIQWIEDRILLRKKLPVEVIPMIVGENSQNSFELLDADNSLTQLIYHTNHSGNIQSVTVFLTHEWTDAQIDFVDHGSNNILRIAKGLNVIELPVDFDHEK